MRRLITTPRRHTAARYAAAKYRRDYKPHQRGLLSIALNSDWREPLSTSPSDVAASQRSMEFNLGWAADPIYFGEYPSSMRARLGARLPAFSPEQQKLLVNSTDFFALQVGRSAHTAHIDTAV